MAIRTAPAACSPTPVAVSPAETLIALDGDTRPAMPMPMEKSATRTAAALTYLFSPRPFFARNSRMVAKIFVRSSGVKLPWLPPGIVRS